MNRGAQQPMRVMLMRVDAATAWPHGRPWWNGPGADAGSVPNRASLLLPKEPMS